MERIRLNNPTFNVLIMCNDSSLQHVGTVTTSGYISNKQPLDKSNVTHKFTINEILVDSVNIFNQNILTIIANDCTSYFTHIDRHCQLPIVLPCSEDINGTIFKILRYRRCTVYLVHQISLRGERYLAYFSDKIVHSGECFGIDSYGVGKDKIIEEIHTYHTNDISIENMFGI